MTSHKNLLLLVITFLAFFNVELSYANQGTSTLILDFKESSYLDPCEDVGEWTLKSINKIHEPSSLFSKRNKDRSTHSGLSACGYIEAQCKTKMELDSWGEDEKKEKHTWYVSSYPTVYSEDAQGAQIINNQLALIGFSEHALEFIPLSNAIDSESRIKTIEKSFTRSANGSDYRFFDVKTDEKFSEGKALCRINKRQWGEAMPDNCIVTRFKTSGRHYVLGLVERDPFPTISCPVSANFEILQELSFSQINSEGFKKHLIKSLEGNELKMDSDRIDADGNIEFGITVIAAAGPRLSPINSRYREQIDVTILFRPSRDNSLRVKGHLAAWISRQNTDPAGSWRMPEKSYYNELDKRLKNAVNDAFEDLCTDNNKKLVLEESFYGLLKKCQ